MKYFSVAIMHFGLGIGVRCLFILKKFIRTFCWEQKHKMIFFLKGLIDNDREKWDDFTTNPVISQYFLGGSCETGAEIRKSNKLTTSSENHDIWKRKMKIQKWNEKFTYKLGILWAEELQEVFHSFQGFYLTSTNVYLCCARGLKAKKDSCKVVVEVEVR
jgi:hypothetical protein